MGYGPAATAIMAARTAQSHAAFFLPYLKPGMRVLDCGCGPGIITVGFAELVAPGEVIGTELEKAQTEAGQRRAAKRGLTNVRFESANIYELPFPDESFDAVFISAVLGNLRKPLRGLAETCRVLKTGGIIGVKEFDDEGNLIFPADPELIEGIELYKRLRRHNGHDPEIGRKVPFLLSESGFRELKVAAVYENFSGILPQVGELFSHLVSEAFDEPMQRLGWATAETVQRIVTAWKNFPTRPGAFYAMAWCEAVGRK